MYKSSSCGVLLRLPINSIDAIVSNSCDQSETRFIVFGWRCSIICKWSMYLNWCSISVAWGGNKENERQTGRELDPATSLFPTGVVFNAPTLKPTINTSPTTIQQYPLVPYPTHSSIQQHGSYYVITRVVMTSNSCIALC